MRHCRVYAVVLHVKDDKPESASMVLTVAKDLVDLISKVTPYVTDVYLDDKYDDPISDHDVEPIR